jgi:hypothetical protein
VAYPGTLDNVPDAPLGSENLGESTPTHSEHHQALVDELNLIETELGTNPSGASADVAARFTANESAATTLAGRVTTAEGDITALESAVAALPGGDARVFDVVAYGAAVDGSTDDTNAWQDAIDAAAAAGGGRVTSSVNGVSIIGGALQDASGANAQLLLPVVDYVDGELLSLTIGGLTQPPAVFSLIGTTPLPDNHLVLKSTLASGTGAVVGAKGPVGTFGSFTNVHLRLENLTVRTVNNPTISALDLRRVATVDIDAVVVDSGQYTITSLTEPTTSTSYGIRLPGNDNGAHVRLGQVDVVGFYTGYEIAEHVTGGMVTAGGCKVAAEFDATHHASTFLRFMAVWCERVLKFTGIHAVDIWQLNVEHAASGWYTTDYDLDDASNYGKGFLRWHAVLAGVGDHNSFTVNGGSGFTTSRVGAAIGSGGGGGSTTYVYRDRLVAGTTNTTLTLGATPVANSPLLWINDVIQWPTTDYTISGAVITLNAALTIADVVLVQYHSTASSASASALSGGGLSITDDFTGADSASSMSGRSTTTGAATWISLDGTWGIASNQGYMSAAPGSSLGKAVVDSTAVDCTVATVINYSSGQSIGGLVFRATDQSNCYMTEVTVSVAYAPKIYKVVAGVVTVLATGASITVNSGDTLSVELSGTSIIVKRNGSTIVSTTDATYTTQTKHGFYAYNTTGSPTGLRFDNLNITA